MVIFDIPGAYLNADMIEDKFLLLKVEDEFLDIMCEVNPEFKKPLNMKTWKITRLKGIESIIWMYQVRLAVVQSMQGYYGKGRLCIESL